MWTFVLDFQIFKCLETPVEILWAIQRLLSHLTHTGHILKTLPYRQSRQSFVSRQSLRAWLTLNKEKGKHNKPLCPWKHDLPQPTHHTPKARPYLAVSVLDLCLHLPVPMHAMDCLWLPMASKTTTLEPLFYIPPLLEGKPEHLRLSSLNMHSNSWKAANNTCWDKIK